jgi:hypothetical protein
LTAKSWRVYTAQISIKVPARQLISMIIIKFEVDTRRNYINVDWRYVVSYAHTSHTFISTVARPAAAVRQFDLMAIASQM